MRPPVLALEHSFFELFGETAFTDERKQLAGRITRAAGERLGGRRVGGQKVVVGSRYSSDSIYSFDEEDAEDLPDDG